MAIPFERFSGLGLQPDRNFVGPAVELLRAPKVPVCEAAKRNLHDLGNCAWLFHHDGSVGKKKRFFY